MSGPTRPGTVFGLRVSPRIPARLARLEELAGDLWYSWERSARHLFARLNPPLWDALNHCPRALLRRIDERRLAEAAASPEFLEHFDRVIAAYDAYHRAPAPAGALLSPGDLVAYFCAEFGVHESLPIYSGGLGILAADLLKAASDARVPLVGVGLLYRQGYFHQKLDGDGAQQAEYHDSDFEELPVAPAKAPDGAELRVRVELGGRSIAARVWQGRIGHVSLYLLDTDLEENEPRDRSITHRLYGGDRTTRIEQEIVLGVGGVRALQALGLEPTVWHINEGHAAFLVLERARALAARGVEFAAALEACAASTVFTTHTPVSAGHDRFTAETMRAYFEPIWRAAGIDFGELAALGREDGDAEFSMTALAVRGSRFQNGVSRIHGRVTALMHASLWPEIPAEENPLTHITNGVHVPTFITPELREAFDQELGAGWHTRLRDPEVAARLAAFPDGRLAQVRRQLKTRMLHLLRHRVRQRHLRNHGSESRLDRMLRLADPANPDVLTIGFGRRFASYKRATLMFEDLERLKAIIGDPRRPVLLVIAGKAHPADRPGQDLMRQVAQVSRMPEFEGRVLLVEGYDLHFARRLVAGVDVWLNNPLYQLEASGTSGMKAGINGTINLSVLDGWWDEGFDGSNGWAIRPASPVLEQYRRDREESQTLYELLQDQVLPLYYDARGPDGYSPGWIALAKRSIASILPRFSAARMLEEYVERCYVPAARQGRALAGREHAPARELALWKARVRQAWPGVQLRRLDAPQARLAFGEALRAEVAATLNGLAPEDLCVELLLADAMSQETRRSVLRPEGGTGREGEARFVARLAPELCGQIEYRIRAYPRHALLAHPFELGLMRWL
jgi:starch phosphorylase